ncbi:MAG: hypothetical protein ABWY06_20905 [Pseudomonas sp.]|uniref:hypothetical protein n=1 Tax=Pseudomonas sp. TaxID=306 RepID=UPI00339B940A
MTSKWDDYIEARSSGLKIKWKPLLAEQLGYIADLGEKEKKVYLEELCHQYFDLGKTQIPIQEPAIWDAILVLWKDRLSWNDEQLLLWIVKSISFKGTYQLLEKDPRELLRRILALNPGKLEAKTLLFEELLDILDFAMHSIDTGMLIDKSVGEAVICECEVLLAGEPDLKLCKTRFGGDFAYYKNRFLAGYDYSRVETDLSFDEWYNSTI